MDNETNINLDQLLIEEGEQIIRTMDTTEMKPSAALWFYFKEQNIWRLLIASPYFNELAAQDRYRRFIESFNLTTYQQLKLGDITLFGSNDPFISLFKVAVTTNSESISKISFISSTINGVFIDSALIYRIT